MGSDRLCGGLGEEKRSVVILRAEDHDEWLHSNNVEVARAMLQLLRTEMLRAMPSGE